MVISHNQWRTVVKQDIWKEVDLKVSEGKDMKSFMFNEKRYMSLHRIYKRHECVYDTYINLNEEKW